MAKYYFNIRDEFGLIEDPDGLEFPSRLALLLEALRSADEFLEDSVAPSRMRLEITDTQGHTIFMTPIQQSFTTWNYLSNLSAATGDMH
jgi:hypothetical protein